MDIVIAGGSGLIGAAVTAASLLLADASVEPAVLTRAGFTSSHATARDAIRASIS